MNELSQLGPLTALPHDRGSQSPYHLETPWGASGTLLSLGDNQAPSGPGFWEPRSPVSRVSSGSRPWTGGRQAGQPGREPGGQILNSSGPQPAACHPQSCEGACWASTGLCSWGGSGRVVGGRLSVLPESPSGDGRTDRQTRLLLHEVKGKATQPLLCTPAHTSGPLIHTSTG